MKILNNKLAVLFIFVILLTSCGICVSAKAEENHLELMSYVNIIDLDVDAETVITRGEFAQYLAKLSGFNEDEQSLKTGSKFFLDVDTEHEYYSAIRTLEDMGIIRGYDDLKFYPDDLIEPKQAIRMIVSMLGFDYIAEFNGGYPNGYIKTAEQMDILDGINIYDKLTITYDDMCRMFYNILECDVSESTRLGAISNGNFMRTVLKIDVVEGLVQDDSVSNLYGGSKIRSGYVQVGDMVLSNPHNFQELLGKKIKAYYSMDDEQILIYPIINSQNEVMTIDAENLESFSDNRYTIKYNNRKTTETISTKCTIIYNNSTITDSSYLTNSFMIPENGYIRLIDNDGDGIFDVVFINNYITVVVGSYDTDKNIIYDVLTGEKYYLEDYEDVEVVLTNDSGVEIQPSEVFVKNTVLSIYKSADDKRRQIVCVYKTLSETVKEYYSTDDSILTESGIYFFTDELVNNDIFKEMKPGRKYEFYMNTNGFIAYFELGSDDTLKTGYITNCSDVDAGGEYVYANIYSDNALDTYVIDRKTVIDGTKVKAPEQVKYLLDFETNLKLRAVRFTADENKHLIMVDTVADNSDGSKSMIYNIPAAATGYQYHHTYGGVYNWNSIYHFDSKAVIILVSEPYINGEIMSGTLADVRSKTGEYAFNKSNVEFYKFEDDGLYVDFAVMHPKYVQGAAQYPASTVRRFSVVTDIYESVNADGFVSTTLKMCSGATQAECRGTSDNSFTFGDDFKFGTDNKYHVSKGDIIAHGKNLQEETASDNFIVLYDADRKVWNNTVYTSTNFHDTSFMQEVWIMETDNNLVQFSWADPAVDPDSSSKVTLDISKGNILIYDTVNDELTTGKVGDLATYSRVGTECSHGILTTTGNMGTPNLVIYKY